MKVIAKNRRASFDFEILETVEAGLQLSGGEVKSCRAGDVSLAGAYVSFLKGVPILKHLKINRYRYADATIPYEPEKDRVLLLKASEAKRLETATAEKGIAVIPLELHAGKFIKILLGIARGRKTVDKRHRIKEREMGRNLKEGKEI